MSLVMTAPLGVQYAPPDPILALNPLVYLRATSDAMTMSGDDVASFTNLGTAGGTATAAGPNNVPRVDDYFGPGRHAVLNTAAVRASFHLALTLSSKSGITLVSLGRATGNSASRYTVGWGTSGTHQAFQQVTGTTSELRGVHRTNAGNSARLTARSWVGPAVMVTTHDISGAGASECAAWVNGESRDAGDGGFNNNNTTNFDGAGTFKFLDNAASAAPALGHWHACLMFDRILTTEEIAIVSDWGRAQLNILAGQPAGIYMPTGLWEGGIGVTLNTTPDPDQISAWADQSGYARHVTEGTADAQPEALLVAATKYVPRFLPARETRLNGSALSTLITASEFTVIACYRPRSPMTYTSQVQRAPSVWGASNSTRVSQHVYENGGYFAEAFLLDAGPANRFSGPVPVTNEKITVIVTRASGGTLLCRVFDDAGARESSGTGGTIQALTAVFSLGRAVHADSFGSGDLFDIATYNTGLSDDDIAKIAANMLAGNP